MPTVVVPFRGVKGKSRLGRLRREARVALAHAMLADVLEACEAIGPTVVVAPDGTDVGDAILVVDPGGGQGAAVTAGLDAAVASGGGAPYLVVNADLACVTARDLFTLAGAVPDGGLALAPAADGTTNALALASPDLFEPVYGRGSAARFAALAPSRPVDAPNLVDDVDTVADLERLAGRVGQRTRAALAKFHVGAAA
jgi:2-phospho-L-lactate/phosphoenolpyruvate guanylyltransferase